MPEGPEVRRAADRIEKAIGKSPIIHLQLYAPALNGLTSSLVNNQLQKVHTYGKAFVLEFKQSIFIYVHLQLYGVWKTGRRSTTPKTNRSLRIWLETNTHYAALYSATTIEVLTPNSIPKHPYIRKLGPDLLNRPTLGVSHVSRRLGNTKFSRRSLGHLLLDQSFFAGVGNYLRSEILFAAKLHPGQTIGKLSSEQKTELARAIHTMLHRAYKTGGITTTPEVVKDARNAGKRRRQYRHYVFARHSLPCRVCGSKIKKQEIAGRRLYMCMTCQPQR